MLEVNNLIGFGADTGGGSAHKHWRLYFITKTSADYASAFEIEMRATTGGADQCSGGTATASSTDTTNVPARAFDDNSTTYFWLSNATLAGQWIAYEFASPVEVSEIWYKPYHFGSLIYGPAQFGVEYSDNGTDWVRAKTYSGLTWAAGEAKTLTV